MDKIEKQVSTIRCSPTKTAYLLGINRYGEGVWLESPSWDCGWYWGFGYVETYIGHPRTARDISSHSHFDGLVWFKDGEKYVYHLNESPFMVSTVLTNEESWELSDLMKQFYTLKDAAGIFYSGNAKYSASRFVDNKDLEMCDKINEVILPKIFRRIIEILTPAAIVF